MYSSSHKDIEIRTYTLRLICETNQFGFSIYQPCVVNVSYWMFVQSGKWGLILGCFRSWIQWLKSFGEDLSEFKAVYPTPHSYALPYATTRRNRFDFSKLKLSLMN